MSKRSLWEPPRNKCAYLASGAGEVSCVEVREILAEGRSEFQTYAVLDTVAFGALAKCWR